jgi:hypothetical protein
MTIAVGGESLKSKSTLFPPLLPPVSGDRLLAVIPVVISTFYFIVVVPFAKDPLAPMPAFVP